MRAPLRVALGGGGTDLASYYREHGGLVVSTAIDKYVHMTVSSRFQRRFVLKHLEWEEVDEPGEVRHPILRAALDAPLGGRRRSSWPRSATLRPGRAWARPAPTPSARSRRWPRLSGRELDPARLAEAACHLEIEVLGRSIGKQDQYAAAFGGARVYEFQPDGRVEVRELRLSEAMRAALRDKFLLVFTGRKRSASDILGAGQDEDALHRLKRAGRRDLRGARGRRARPGRRADERALGGKAQARPRHRHERDGRAARPRAGARERVA